MSRINRPALVASCEIGGASMLPLGTLLVFFYAYMEDAITQAPPIYIIPLVGLLVPLLIGVAAYAYARGLQ